MSRRLRAGEHGCAAGLAGAHPGLQDRILLSYTTGLPTCLHQKKTDLVPISQKKPSSRFEAYAHKICTTTHKIDIKTQQNHRYNTSPIFRSIFFPRNYTVVHLFFINNIDHLGNSKMFAIFCAPCMVIDPRRKRFVMNKQLFYFQKSQRCSKSQNFKVWLQKSRIVNPATQELRMRMKYARKLSIFCYV